MDMEIVKEIVEYNQTGMTVAKCLMILLLIPFSITIISIIKQKKSKVKGKKFKKISVVILMYTVAMIIVASSIYVLFKMNARYTNVKVEGQGVLEKYEDEGEGKVMAKLKGKDNQEINIYLDNDDVFNQKEKIHRGDKVRVKSDKAYGLIKREAFIPNKKVDDIEYVLKEGSELEKVE